MRLRLDFNNNERQTSKEIGTENNFRFPIILVSFESNDMMNHLIINAKAKNVNNEFIHRMTVYAQYF